MSLCNLCEALFLFGEVQCDERKRDFTHSIDRQFRGK